MRGSLSAPLVVLVAFALLVLLTGPGRLGDAGGDEGAASVPSPGEVYDPYFAGEQLPPGYRQLLPRDAIRPVYRPTFVEAREADYAPDTLVIGVNIDGEARAYPVNVLNRREMVIDRLSGVPILVTW